MKSPLKYPLIWLLKAYRFTISPLYGQVCRYHPTCSAYALQAVETHGAMRGTYLSVRRVLRCHPWSAGGYDPVPLTHSAAQKHSASQRHRGEQCSVH